MVQGQCSRPGSLVITAPPPRPPWRPPPGGTSPGWQGLIDMTSNFGLGADADCASMGGAWRMPMTMGVARAAAAKASAVFRDRVSWAVARWDIIASILACRFAPVTPETQASGDSIRRVC